MSSRVTRRQFVLAGAAGAAAAAIHRAAGAAPSVLVPGPARPVVVSAANGAQFKNGGAKTCVEEAFERIARGEDVVEALVAGVNIVELDPEEISVGYGGLPNADGVVQLDASCMHGPRKRAGAVAALEGVRTPSRVALAVMNETDHHLLVGAGAQAFARRLGFAVEDDLNTPKSRKLWLDWKRRTDPDHYLDPAARELSAARARDAMIGAGLVDPAHVFGTIHCNAVTAKGEIGGATTTSGLAFKIPGRVGDSPILGAGNYVDGEVGAAGSTGRGEANLFHCASFLIVEEMRRGAHPKDACLAALKRIAEATRERRLRNLAGRPNFQLKFYALDKTGRHAGVAMYALDAPGRRATYAVCTEKGPETPPMDALFEGTARP